MMTLDKFEEASERVKEVILPTNLIYSEYYSAQTGAKVYFKPENMQYTGAYKVRGAYYKHSFRRRTCQRTDHGLCRKPCTGSCLCCKNLWCKSCDRYAYDNPIDQSKPYQELRSRSRSSR